MRTISKKKNFILSFKRKMRTFTVIEVSTVHGVVKGRENLGGVFHNETPVGAARKAASKICSMSKIRGRCTLIITVQETTRGSLNKIYRYKVTRIKDVKEVVRDGVPITFRYVTKAVSLQGV